MTAAQATKLSVETVGSATPAAQATKLGVESLTSPSAYTAQGVKLFTEVLASVQLAGPAQAILLNTETLGSVDAVIAEAWQLSTETLGNTTPTVLTETLWVEVLSSAADDALIPQYVWHEKCEGQTTWQDKSDTDSNWAQELDASSTWVGVVEDDAIIIPCSGNT